ncbi:hypothetical protein AMET1_0149 [Methanonatronarchaeum thermophilum]|uniref:Uncharacterized protein n=1 Tax=Methanonatronarchaeum thermophilum TaxID=1927129 RepID=A0A1Y3GDJ8_9EURY|nr:hypothetical protein [Methanonatronarchaeum thermophilum]OUJ19479.1 hypothetical protein AMET1_0149 [Methanonatronarchaeum thermophilum]
MKIINDGSDSEEVIIEILHEDTSVERVDSSGNTLELNGDTTLNDDVSEDEMIDSIEEHDGEEDWKITYTDDG